MSDRKALNDPNETPEDVATLYSWANLHGAKYRDFSASRAQTRERARQRVQQAIEEERERVRQQVEAQRAAEAKRAAEAGREEEEARQAEALRKPGAQLAMRQVSQPSNIQPAQESGRPPAQGEGYAAQTAQQTPWQPAAERFTAIPPLAPAPLYPAQPDFVPPAAYRPVGNQPQQAPAREAGNPPPRHQWAPGNARESTGRPAWMGADPTEAAASPAELQAPEETLQGSRERLTSRWFALKGIFEGAMAPAEAASAQAGSRVPVLAVFSLAGGVGKTSLVATLARALSARGERVLLVDTTAFGLLPFFFGARDQRPGLLRTFTPPTTSGDAPVQMVTLDPDTLGPENASQETLASEILKHGRSSNRVLVDLATASAATVRRVLRISPVILVPVVPDMSSVVSVASIESFFQHNPGASGKPVQPHFVLNQFDPSLPLHLDVREVLRERLGDRLLPFALRRTPAVSEALAEGMTVMDYAPNSTVAEDFGSLAGWIKNLSAPASTSYRGVRWSER